MNRRADYEFLRLIYNIFSILAINLMSSATVSTSKLPFGIQTILADDDEENKFCDPNPRIVAESSVAAKSCDKDNLPQRRCASWLTPNHFPCRNTKVAAFEVTTTLPSIPFDYCKILKNMPVTSGPATRDYCCCAHLALPAQYSPIRYGFPSTSVAVPNQFTQFKFSTDFGNWGGAVSNQSQGSRTPRSTDSLIVDVQDVRQTAHTDSNNARSRFWPVKNPSSLPFLPLSTPSVISCSTVSGAAKHDGTNRRAGFMTPRRIGHSYQSRAPARHKKPRTSFTKKQV